MTVPVTLTPRALVVVRRPKGSIETVATRERRTRALHITLGVLTPLVALLILQAGAAWGWWDRRIYPAPTDLINAARVLWTTGHLGAAIWSTFRLVIEGFALGSVAGILVGIVTGLSRVVRAALEPMLDMLYVVPKIALLPIFLTVFGLGQTPKIALVTVTVFFFVWISAMEAFASVPSGFVEAAKAFSANRRAMFIHVYFPSALPQIMVALRISMGVSVLIAIAGEFVIGTQGLGFLIINSTQLFLMPAAYAAIAVVSILGVALVALVAVIGRLVTPWAESSRRRNAL
jgi:sulfonate transport system permease protein